jgi:two-component system chemotaxis sensor kinase CheA
VPISSVVEITRVSGEEIHRVDHREVLRLRDQVLTVVRLSSLQGIHALGSSKNAKKNFVVVIGAAEKRFGLIVDQLVGEEELVIKLFRRYRRQRSGQRCFDPGDGTVVLILNVPAVLSRLSRAIHLGLSHERTCPSFGGGRFRADAEADP